MNDTKQGHLADWLREPGPGWILPDLFPDRCLVVLHSTPDLAGIRSQLARSLALSVAKGESWNDVDVPQFPVVYLGPNVPERDVGTLGNMLFDYGPIDVTAAGATLPVPADRDCLVIIDSLSDCLALSSLDIVAWDFLRTCSRTRMQNNGKPTILALNDSDQIRGTVDVSYTGLQVLPGQNPGSYLIREIKEIRNVEQRNRPQAPDFEFVLGEN